MLTPNKKNFKKLSRRVIVPDVLEVLKSYDYATRLKFYDRLRIEFEKEVEQLTIQQKMLARVEITRRYQETKKEMDEIRQQLIADGTNVRLVATYLELQRKLFAIMSDPQGVGYVEDTNDEIMKRAKEKVNNDKIDTI